MLATLLESFRFSLTDKEIVWNLAGVSYPTMAKESIQPSLLLNVGTITPGEE